MFSEASAKVRTFSEPRKSFREKFSNLTHFPAIVDGGQGHIRQTHYYNYIDGGEMEREGRKGRDGAAEDAGVDYGADGGNIQGNGYGGGMERAWLGKRLSMKR